MSAFCQDCGGQHPFFVDAVRCDINTHGEQRARLSLLRFTPPDAVDELIRAALDRTADQATHTA